MSNFLSKNVEEQSGIFKVLKKEFTKQNLFSAKLSFKCEGEIQILLNKEQTKKFITGKHALQEIFKVLHGDGKEYKSEISAQRKEEHQWRN